MKNKLKLYLPIALIPVLAIMVFCIRYGQNFFSFYLPDSHWNDEVIYYKTIEGIVGAGTPQGYFGYNESHALNGTFGAWSPIIYSFDVVWGKIFGWNLYMPVMARLVFAIIGFGVYAVCKRPNVKESLSVALFVSSFVLYARYLMSQMSDIYIVTLMIMFIALKNKKMVTGGQKWRLLLSIMVIFLTLIRPYFLILWIIVWDYKDKKENIAMYSVMGVVSFTLYLIISHYKTASYFYPLINNKWIKLIMENPLMGIRNVCDIIRNALSYLCEHLVLAFSSGDDVGLQYFIFMIFTITFAVLTFKTKEKEKRTEWICWFIVNVICLLAFVLLYDTRVGSRHLMPFIVAEGILLIGELNIYVRISYILLTCYLCLVMFSDTYYTVLPKYSSSMEQILTDMNSELSRQICVEENEEWENTLIWVYSDSGGWYPWQTLYALPKGMGINLCTYEYIISNFDNLRSGYIACTESGDIAELCKKSGYKELYANVEKNIGIFQIGSN